MSGILQMFSYIGGIFKNGYLKRVTLSDDGTRSTAIAYNDLIYNGYYS